MRWTAAFHLKLGQNRFLWCQMIDCLSISSKNLVKNCEVFFNKEFCYLFTYPNRHIIIFWLRFYETGSGIFKLNFFPFRTMLLCTFNNFVFFSFLFFFLYRSRSLTIPLTLIKIHPYRTVPARTKHNKRPCKEKATDCLLKTVTMTVSIAVCQWKWFVLLIIHSCSYFL